MPPGVFQSFPKIIPWRPEADPARLARHRNKRRRGWGARPAAAKWRARRTVQNEYFVWLGGEGNPEGGMIPSALL